jgi:3-oxoacyl-(acyl-carrier-protein) synthase
MRIALAAAGISPDEVDYINAHATSTPAGNRLEAQGIAKIIGEIPTVSSTKSMTGHQIAAAGATGLICVLLMMRHGFVAPNANIEQVAEVCRGINIVADAAVDVRIDVAFPTNFDLGGSTRD